MNTILLLLLGLAIVIIIVMATSRNKKHSPPKTVFPEVPEKKKKTKKSNKLTSPDIGPEDFMRWKTNEIPREFLTPKKDLEDKSHYFYGKKVCISGQLNSFPYRAELAKQLHELGADVDTGVGKTCGILISGDGVGPSKLKKAKEQGVYIMDEHELSEKLNGFKSKYI